MPDLVTLGPWLRRFLCEYIVAERNLAWNTRKSYRDTFRLLLPFISRKVRKPVDRLVVWDLTSERVLQFLIPMPPPVGWLTRAEMEAMLAVPDRRTRRGRSEYALLLFLWSRSSSSAIRLSPSQIRACSFPAPGSSRG